jgi:D-3-phosphoglycerate dehydrogenase / 2-oxoglutarate reductase
VVQNPLLVVAHDVAQSCRVVCQEDHWMKGLFMDAVDDLAAVFYRVVRPTDPLVTVQERAEIKPQELPGLTAGYDFILDDHTQLPTEAMRGCKGLKHIIFLGTGARSYMHPEELAEIGITVHIIKGYGDTAVAEHSIALMWAAARGLARMDGGMRAGNWIRTEGMELTGKTLGLVGFGGIAAEVARIAVGSGMRVLAWNRSAKTAPGVTFVDLDTLLAESEVLSVHLLLHDETRGFLSAERLAKARPGAILVNTARAAVVDEAAMIAALRSGHLRHAALDVFNTEPLPAGHELTTLPNVTLSAHSAFRTPEASDKLIRMALDIACELRDG